MGNLSSNSVKSDQQSHCHMDSLLPFHPAICNLLGRLSFKEVKSLSIVSWGWWEATSSCMANRSILRVKSQPHRSEIVFLREYKYVVIHSKIDLIDVLEKLPNTIETMELIAIKIRDLKQLQKLKKLKSLRLFYCTFVGETIEPADLVLQGLQSLTVSFKLKPGFNLIQEFVRANKSITRLDLESLEDPDEVLEAATNDFLRNIHLPLLQEFSLESVAPKFKVECATNNKKFKVELINFFQKHKSLKHCRLIGLEIEDKAIEALLKSSEKIMGLTLIDNKCSGSKKVILSELKLMSTLKRLDLSPDFESTDFENFNPRQLESFRLMGIQLFSMNVRSILQSMSNIRVLNISHFEIAGGDSHASILKFISEQMPHLVDLTLGVIYTGMVSSLEGSLRFEKLESLALWFVAVRSNVRCNLICLINAPRLRKLDISQQADEIELKEVTHIFHNSPLIEELLFSEKIMIADSVLEYIAKHSLPCLRKLRCAASIEGLRMLRANTRIEHCVVFMSKEDLDELTKGRRGFKDFIYSARNKVITNGVTTIHLKVFVTRGR